VLLDTLVGYLGEWVWYLGALLEDFYSLSWWCGSGNHMWTLGSGSTFGKVVEKFSIDSSPKGFHETDYH
jgi:hypothetical protein